MNPRSLVRLNRTGILLFCLASSGFLLTSCGRHERTFDENYKDGLKFFEKGRYEMAQSRFEKATIQNPDSSEAKYQLAITDLKLQDDTSAFPLLRAAEEKDRKSSVSPLIRLELAKLFMAAKQYEQAQRRLLWILERDPNNHEARGLLGSALAGLAKPEDATQEVDRLLTEDPANLQGRVLKASIQLAAHDAASAEAVLVEGVKQANRSSDSILALGHFYQLVGQYAKAAELFLELVKKDPKNVRVRESLGELYARAGDRASAERTFKELATVAPNDHNAVMALANFYVTTRDWNAAIAELERLNKAKPDTQTRNTLAQIYYFAGKRAEALKLTDELIKENSQNMQSRMLRGMLLMSTGQNEQAVTEFTHVLYYQADLAPAHYFLAISSMATGNEQVALQHMERALQINKSMIGARLWLADYHFRRGEKDIVANLVRETPEDQRSTPDLVVMRILSSSQATLSLEDQAALQGALGAKPSLILDYADRGLAPFLRSYGAPLRDNLEKMVKTNPKFQPSQTVLIKLLETQGKQDQALSQLEKKIEANPKSYSDLLQLAKLQIRAGKIAAAKATLQKANLERAGTADILLGMAEVETASGNLEAARGYLEELTRKYPNVAEGFGRLGELQERRHALTEARAAYEKALQLDPRNAIAANNLAWMMANSMGDLEKGLELAKKAHQLDPSSAGFCDTLGWIQFKLANYPEALQNLGEAARRDPNDAYIRYHLGMAQSRSGREREALMNLQSALKGNPRMPEATEIRGEIANLLRTTSR